MAEVRWLLPVRRTPWDGTRFRAKGVFLSGSDGAVSERELVDPLERKRALNRLYHRIGELSSLPDVATRVVEVAQDSTSSAHDLLEIVENDPALATRVLRTVNSSRYGLRNSVRDLKSAITLLGFHEIRSLALTLYVADKFREPGTYRTYDRKGLWNHSVAVGTIARLVARSCNLPHPEEAYLAGLLHDIGLILIDHHLRKHFCRVIDEVAKKQPTTEVEQRVLTFDHAQLGEYVARQWHFPEPIAVAIGYHHNPKVYEGSHRELLHTVVVANYMASQHGLTSLGVANIAPPSSDILSDLWVNSEQMDAIVEGLDEALDKADSLATV